jgi:hypothetical protein
MKLETHPLSSRVVKVFGVLCLAAVAGCGAGSGTTPPTAPSPPSATENIVYTAIGASDAAGVGSSAVCIPFTECPNGMGYVQVIARRLAEGRQVKLPTSSSRRRAQPELQALAAQYPPSVPPTSSWRRCHSCSATRRS